jgi:hypothetical protein
MAHLPIPADFPVQPLKPGEPAEDRTTCGTCGLSWDDAKLTAWTPTPSGRCPFEYFHVDPKEPSAKPEPRGLSTGLRCHRVSLTNGRVLLIEETEEALHIASELDATWPGEIDMYVCVIRPSGVEVMTNSGDAVQWLTEGLKKPG